MNERKPHFVVIKSDDGKPELYPLKDWLRRHPEFLPPGKTTKNTSHALRSALTKQGGWKLIEHTDRVLVVKYDEKNEIAFASETLREKDAVRVSHGSTVHGQVAKLTSLEATLSNRVPLLTNDEVVGAIRMARLYAILHCYENSVRKFVEKVLSKELGDTWWIIAASDAMRRNVESRQQTEHRKRWISPRGAASPLYYLDWGDLEKLVKKYDKAFLPYIGELRFIESRFGDLEGLRNIVAHHGVLPSEDDFQRVILNFNDWIRQVGELVKDL